MTKQAITKSRPLVIGLPGSFDPADFPSYDSWLKCLPELGVDVRVLDMFRLPGVRQVGKDERGPIYYCDWHPQDYFNLIQSTIDEFQPSKTILLGFSFGAYEAMRAAFMLELLGKPVTGVVSITPSFLDYKKEAYRSAGDWQKRPEAELGTSPMMDGLIELHKKGPSVMSCVRYEDLRNPHNGSASTFYIPTDVLQRYRMPSINRDVVVAEIEEYQRLRFDKTEEFLRARHYTTPTVLMATADSSYYPPEKVNALARRIKYAPVGFVELPGVCYDFRAYPGQVERVTETIMDKVGQLLTTKSVHQIQPLHTFLATKRSVADQPMQTIVLSSARPPYHHKQAIRLAKQTGANLAVLTSHDLDPNVVAADCVRAGVHGLIMNLPDRYRLPLTAGFATAQHPSTLGHKSNLSAKRNIGLLLGLLSGQKIFFLDDDIHGLSAGQLYQASAHLEHFAVAGFQPKTYPDNSVVCHANRLAGGQQAVFISGSSLAVNPVSVNSFFPDIYCEDTIFMHDSVKTRQAVLMGNVRQLPYDPFWPERAAGEEFGDVLCESIYYLLAAGSSLHEAGEDFWRFTIWRRKRFVADIVRRLSGSLSTGDNRVPQALTALKASETELDVFTPNDFTSYIRAWRDDVDRWQNNTTSLPQTLSFDQAANFLARSFGLPSQLVGQTGLQKL